MRHIRPIATLLLVATLPACFSELPPAPTKGYGDPYRGTGKPIYVKDGRSDWNIAEGGKPITSEQALEATKDEEYEIRRQEAKKYNAQLFAEGQSHRSTGRIMMWSGTALTVAGFGVMLIAPTLLREETTAPATRADPEKRVTEPGGASGAALAGGLLVGLVGVGLLVYGVVGGNKNPPYQEWHTPQALNRPAYVREKTEPYNESIGAPPVEDQPGSVESVPLAPGQRKPPPERPTAKPRPGAPAGSAAPAAPMAPAPSAKPAPSAAPAPSAKPAPSAPYQPVTPGQGLKPRTR